MAIKRNLIITITCALFGFYQVTDGTVTIVVHKIVASSGSSFTQYVKNSNDEIILNCTLEYVHNSSFNQLMISMDQLQDFSNETVFGKRLTNLERNICGFKIDDCQIGDPAEMTLIASYIKTDGEESTYIGKFSVNIHPATTYENTVLNATLGSKAEIVCEGPGACTLHDPHGNLVKDDFRKCNETVSHVGVKHVGNWTCGLLENGNSPFYYKWFIEVRLVKEPFIRTWYKEEDGFGIIGCKYVAESKIDPIEFCQFIDPHKQIYTVSSISSATERYTSVGTYYEKHICQIEFELPIQPNEIGNWMCILGAQDGSFINVSPPTRTFRKEDVDYAKRILINIQLGSQLEIYCQVPYSSDNCYINSPTNEFILGGDINNFRLGECKTSIESTERKHLGIWTCHYSNPTSAVDDIIEVEVREHNSVRSLYKDVESGVSQSAELMCQANIPIQTCQFIGPSGLSYNMFPEKKAEGIDYIGRGLQYGDCGLRIKSVKPEQDGVWTCIVNDIQSPEKFVQDTTRVYVTASTILPFTTKASSIGIAVAVMLVAVSVLGVAIYTRYKKQSPGGRLSDGSNGSNTNVPIINAQIQPVYSTNDPQ